MADSLSDEKKTDKLTKKDIIQKGTIIALFVTIPSLLVFYLAWIILDNLLQAILIGAIVHFSTMGFSLKISKKLSISKED